MFQAIYLFIRTIDDHAAAADQIGLESFAYF